MSVVEEGGNKSEHTDFFIYSFYKKCKAQKRWKLRISSESCWHWPTIILINVTRGKIELLLPTLVLFLPEVAYCPNKSIGFWYKYFWIQVSQQLTTHLGAESFSRKIFAKFSAQAFGNDKMTRTSRWINFGEVEIYIHVLINHSTTNYFKN